MLKRRRAKFPVGIDDDDIAGGAHKLWNFALPGCEVESFSFRLLFLDVVFKKLRCAPNAVEDSPNPLLEARGEIGGLGACTVECRLALFDHGLGDKYANRGRDCGTKGGNLAL